MSQPTVLIGAYALGRPTDADAWHRGLATLEVDGLEHPLPPEDGPGTDAAALAAWLPERWELLVTCIPTVMTRLGQDPAYGLASGDEDGRAAALADVRRALGLAVRLADLSGRKRVVAVEIHSAPGPRGGSIDAFARSLDELARAERADAGLVVEHCDALVEGQVPAKGFFSLHDELTAVGRALGGAPDACLSVGLNWGRSAIEGRSVALPAEHAKAAAATDLLSTVVLSGATGAESAWGAPWADAHIPPHGADPALAASSASLLGPVEAAAFLAAAGPVPVVAAKVAPRPRDLGVEDLLAVARATLAFTREAAGVRA
jgi:hypothetical protein